MRPTPLPMKVGMMVRSSWSPSYGAETRKLSLESIKRSASVVSVQAKDQQHHVFAHSHAQHVDFLKDSRFSRTMFHSGGTYVLRKKNHMAARACYGAEWRRYAHDPGNQLCFVGIDYLLWDGGSPLALANVLGSQCSRKPMF